MLKKAIEESETKIILHELNDEKSKHKYNVKNIPGLIINDELESEGKVLTVREIEKLISCYSY